MESLLKVLSFIMFLVFIFSVVLLIRTFRKPRRVSVRSLVIALFTSLLTLIFYIALLGYKVDLWTWVFMGSIGLIIGTIWAKATRVYIQENTVMSRNSVWYLVVWGAVFALNQLITIVTNKPPSIGMAMLIMSSAIVWGTNWGIIRRYSRVKADMGALAATPTPPPVQAPEPSTLEISQDIEPAPLPGHCPHCGAPVATGISFCRVCEKKL